LLAATVLLAGIGAGQPAPKIEFEKYTLSNGLEVILHVDRKLPMVHVNPGGRNPQARTRC